MPMGADSTATPSERKPSHPDKCVRSMMGDAGLCDPPTHPAVHVQDIGEMEDYMDALQLDPEDLRWGLGQAVSRAYGASPRLIPALDCVNHSRLSSPPIVYALLPAARRPS